MILLDASLRILVVAAVAAVVLAVFRVQSSALRHRVWALVLAAMLLMPALPSIVPAIRVPLPARASAILPDTLTIPGVPLERLPASGIRLERGEPDAVAVTYGPPSPARVLPTTNRPWMAAVLYAAYLAGVGVLALRLALGYRAMRRLVRGATRLDMRGSAPVHVSKQIATPLTAGIVRPTVLLPSAWTAWSEETLRACLAHERAHVRRRDPLVAFASHVNRCVFWFNPLAWWLERTLAATAEHAADDEAVREIGHRRRYAEVLLDMAEAVRLRGGRVAWHAVGVDGSGALGRRIDRVLRGAMGGDASRLQRVSVLVACSAVVAIVVACQRAAAPPPPLQPNAEVADRLEKQRQHAALVETVKKLTRNEVDALEASLARTPADLEALRTLKLFYQTSGHTVLGWNEMVERRRPHILWLIDHHPDHELALWPVSPTADPVTYAEAKKQWLAQTARPDASDRVLTNAAHFLAQADPPLAVQLLERLKDSTARARRLGELYGRIVVGPTSPRDGSPLTPFDSDPYAQQVRQQLEASQDPVVLASAARRLATTYRDERRRDLGRRLLARAVQIDPQQQEAARMLAGLEDTERTNAINERIRLRAAAIAGFAWSPRLSDDERRRLSEAEVLAVAELSERERFDVLHSLAERTYMSGEALEWNKDKASADAAYARSKKYAQDALEIVERFRDDPYYGAAVYRARITMAVHALREGDTAAAVRLMREATTAPASRGFDVHLFALDTRLMNYLLDRGERESVAEFLEHSATLRPADRDRLLKDASAIRAGQMPASYQSMVSRR